MAGFSITKWMTISINCPFLITKHSLFLSPFCFTAVCSLLFMIIFYFFEWLCSNQWASAHLSSPSTLTYAHLHLSVRPFDRPPALFPCPILQTQAFDPICSGRAVVIARPILFIFLSSLHCHFFVHCRHFGQSYLSSFFLVHCSFTSVFPPFNAFVFLHRRHRHFFLVFLLLALTVLTSLKTMVFHLSLALWSVHSNAIDFIDICTHPIRLPYQLFFPAIP